MRLRGERALEAVAALGEPLRRQLFAFVRESEAPVSRDEAAGAAGIKRALAGYHLDRLVDDGLLEVTYARRSGRTGPGAGRPSKLYRPAEVEVTVQLPDRDDALVARLLATAVEADESGSSRSALRDATRAAGRSLGEELAGAGTDRFVEVLGRRGYEPAVGPDGIRLRNCPFHHLVDDHLDLVCALNHDLLSSAAEESGSGFVAELDPQPGHCCVRLRPPDPPTPTGAAEPGGPPVR